MKKTLLTVALILVSGLSVHAAETTVHGTMYGHWMMDMTDGAESYNDFGISRTYFTLKSKLSEKTSAYFTTDIKDIDNYGGYVMILKYAYFDVVPDFGKGKFSFRFGLQPTMYIKYADKAWGRRYLSKSVGDLNNFLTTSDFGASFNFNFGGKKPTAFAGLAIFNGTKYSDFEEKNKQKDFNFYAAIMPFTNNKNFSKSTFFGQFYKGTQNEEIDVDDDAADWKKQIFSVGGKLAYKGTFDLSADFNSMNKGTHVPDGEEKSSAISFFGTLYFGELFKDSPSFSSLNLFGRYDIYDPNTEIDNDGKNLMIVGLECNPIKGFKASLNYRTKSFEDETKDSFSYLYFNTLVEF